MTNKPASRHEALQIENNTVSTPDVILSAKKALSLLDGFERLTEENQESVLFDTICLINSRLCRQGDEAGKEWINSMRARFDEMYPDLDESENENE
jgi:hypothetical protein